MEELAAPTCADCVGFNVKQLDDQGRSRGACRLRPELGLVPEEYPACDHFRVRHDREGKVHAPQKRAPAPTGRRAPRAAPRKTHDALPTLQTPTTGDTSGEINMDRNGLKQVLRELLAEETMYGFPEVNDRWEGGTMVLKPVDANNQPKEVPLDAFFHKIVMVRDRLRVLEAKINANTKMTEQEKVDLQGYVTKCYGTMTTFNILFQDKADHFTTK